MARAQRRRQLPRRERAAGPTARVLGSGGSEMRGGSSFDADVQLPSSPAISRGPRRPPGPRPPTQPQLLSPHFLLLGSQLFTNSLANTPPPGGGQTPPLPTRSSWWLDRESPRSDPGLRATPRGGGGGSEPRGGRFRSLTAQDSARARPLYPHVGPRWFSPGPRADGRQGFRPAGCWPHHRKKDNKTYQVVCRWD